MIETTDDPEGERSAEVTSSPDDDLTGTLSDEDRAVRNDRQR
jgi:hypothetical protein